MYDFLYSLDNGNTYKSYGKIKSEVMLSQNYTGALLGLYSTSNGERGNEFADYDWVKYKGFPR